MFSAVWSEIFSENDFSVMAARGCIDLYTCPSTSEIHHTTSNLVFSYCLTISFGEVEVSFLTIDATWAKIFFKNRYSVMATLICIFS